LIGSSPLRKAIGIVEVDAFAASTVTFRCGNHGYLPANQIGRQCRQTIILIVCKAVFDQDVLTFDITGVFQSTTKCGQKVWIGARRPGAEESDYRHRLLRTRRKRPRRCRVTEHT